MIPALKQLVDNVVPFLPSEMLNETAVFVQLGVAVTIIALGQYSTARRNSMQDTVQSRREPESDTDAIAMMARAKREADELREYIRLLSFLTYSGFLYFLAAPALLVLIAVSRMPHRPDGRLASNLVLVFVILPLIANAFRYVVYAVRRARASATVAHPPAAT